MRCVISAAVLAVGLPVVASAQFTFDQVRSYPYPTELTAAATGTRVAWAFNEQGRRSIYVAEGPTFAARQLTHYDRDDGQELSSVAVSANGRCRLRARRGSRLELGRCAAGE